MRRENIDILAKNPPRSVRLEIKHAGTYIRLFPNTDLPLAVKVPDRFGERFQNVRSLASDRVVDVMCGDNVGLAALQGAGDTEESYDVGVVGVEVLSDCSQKRRRGCLVSTNVFVEEMVGRRGTLKKEEGGGGRKIQNPCRS